MSTTPKKPQDHQKPADAPYAFKAPGVDKNGKPITKTYTLPKATEAAALKVPGGITFDAVMEPDNELAQMRLGLAQLMASDASKETIEALRALPTEEMMKHISEWLGESSGSSD